MGGDVVARTYCMGRDKFTDLCDAIDAVHANLERENESLRRELDRVLGEQEDRDGWVELPKDADGEVWHVGDFVVGEINPRNPKAIERMIWYGPDSGWQLETNTIIYPCPDRPRHHHAPTVEDVLTEFGIDWDHESDCEDRAALLNEYAAKLRLAEGEDA
jgi:hypothetical protein